MKKLFLAILLIPAIGLFSCSDDFLTEQPVDDIFAENLLVNYSGFLSMQNALLALVRDEYDRVDKGYGATSFRSLPFAKSVMFSVGADNAWGNNRHHQFAFFSYPWNITYMTDFEAFQAIFEWLYLTVNTSNMIITRAENPDIDWQGNSQAQNEQHRNQVIANARLIRAWAYRHLTYSFGAVPLSLEEVTGSNYRSDWERTPVDEIREAMEQDWLFAVEHLPMRPQNNTMPSEAIARHYLGELYLAQSRNQEAKDILQPLVEGADYHLMTSRFGQNAANPGHPFIDVFRSPLYSQGNREVLWAFLNTEPENAAFGVGSRIFMRNMWQNYYSNHPAISALSHPQHPGQSVQLFWSLNGGKGAGRVAISLGAYELYHYKDQAENDIRYDEHSIVWHLYFLDANNEVYEILRENGESMIHLEPTPRMSNDADLTIQHYNLPSTKKWSYLHPFFERASIDEQFNDMVYLRLAETYLLYAEALYKLGQGGDYWINQIRERAQVEPISAGDMSIDLILDERSRELITEEQRRHTLVRLSQEQGGNERMAANHFKRRTRMHNEVAGRPVRGMHDDVTPVLFPIPKVFIDSNTGRPIEQNPGY